MQIVENLSRAEKVISLEEAKEKVERQINNTTQDTLWVVKYEGKVISISGEYYKFAWKRLRDLRNALTLKFGKELSDALVRENVIEIYKILV